MIRTILIVLLAIGVVGVGYWGYSEHQEKDAVLLQAENTYQRAFHDLSYQLDLLNDKIGGTLAMSVDRTADEGAGGAADDQASRAVATTAMIAATAVAPDRADIIAVAVIIAALRLGRAVDRHDERGRNGHGRRRSGENKFTHLTSPFERKTHMDNAPMARTVSLT